MANHPECPLCGENHPQRLTCADVQAIADGVTRWNPEGSQVNLRTKQPW